MFNIGTCVLRVSNPLRPVTVLWHLGDTLVLGHVQPGWNYKIASGTELTTKLLAESCMKCFLELAAI